MRHVIVFMAVGLLAVFALTLPARAADWSVPGDFFAIQAALDAASAGDTIHVADGVYAEKLVFPNSGDAVGGPITLQAAVGAHPVLDGTGIVGADMILIDSRSFVRVLGFEIRNDLGVNDGSGIRVIGNGTDIEIRDNVIHDIRGQHAMGITVYGTDVAPIRNLTIDGNQIFDCEPFSSEALTLNGNVTDFEVANNLVRDVNNIGIDFIGGETDIQPDPTKVARNGVCRGNTVMRAKENTVGGFAAGIYIDGGRDIIVERNVVTGCDLGIEVGAENAGIVASGVMVRDNFVWANEKVGIVFGGFKASVGRANDNFFLNNTLYKNDTLHEGFGELWIQFAENNTVRNNVLYANDQNVLTFSEAGNVNNQLDYNLWFAESGEAQAAFDWQGNEYLGLAAFRGGSGQAANSSFAPPQLIDPVNGDLHVAATSPAVDAGDPGFVPATGETDIDGAPRVIAARVDIGADELSCGNNVLEAGEQCDDGNLVDGDGCDSNCTLTACGNGITTPSSGEQCDDGGSVAGDCCDPLCAFEAVGSSCDDTELCTVADACDGSGVCVGSVQEQSGCLGVTLPGKALLQMRNRAGNAQDQLKWKWSRGAATALADFGDPTTTTDYALCIYDESGGGAVSLSLAARIAGGGGCAGKPCWRAVGSKGYRYKDRNGIAGGIRALNLTSGADGKAKLRVKGKAGSLALPILPPAQNPGLVVQLKSSDGVCWTSRFDAPALVADSLRFKDKGE